MEGKRYEHQHVSSFVLGWVRQCGACCIPDACGSNDAAKGSAGSAAKGSGKTIYVLTPSEDHGWTGSVATFAKEKIEEVNKAGVYKAELQTADSASKQIQEVEDILAGNTDEIAGIVIQPMDDTVQSAIQSIVDADIPYVAFDRIIEAVYQDVDARLDPAARINIQAQLEYLAQSGKLRPERRRRDRVSSFDSLALRSG